MHVSRGYFGSWLITTHSPLYCFYPRAASILIHTYFLWKAVKVLSLCHLELNDVHNFPLTKGEKKSSFYTKRTHKELKIKSWWNNFQIKKNIKTYFVLIWHRLLCGSDGLPVFLPGLHASWGREGVGQLWTLTPIPARCANRKQTFVICQTKEKAITFLSWVLSLKLYNIVQPHKNLKNTF